MYNERSSPSGSHIRFLRFNQKLTRAQKTTVQPIRSWAQRSISIEIVIKVLVLYFAIGLMQKMELISQQTINGGIIFLHIDQQFNQ